MIDQGRVSILGIGLDVVDYEGAVARIISAASERRAFGVSALAVHGVMEGYDDPEHRVRLNRLDLVTPDGQPVRWAMNFLHKTKLADRVYGPNLTLRVCEAAAREQLPVFFYGSDEATLALLQERLRVVLPELIIAGVRPSKFGTATPAELDEIAAAIRSTDAAICFVGLGCPRQEVFAYENAQRLSMPVIAVGAAFAYHAGLMEQPPEFVQRWGLQWFHRLLQDPRRLWRRYLILNPRYVVAVCRQRVRGVPDTTGQASPPHVGWA